jgi:hypothetical protein
MKDKSINRNGIRSAQAATGVSPADFDLGSMQSRAAARAIVDHSERSKPRRSQYDEDALQIVSGDRLFLCGLKAEPISRQLKATAIYQQGERLETVPSDEGGEPGQWDKDDPIDRLAELWFTTSPSKSRPSAQHQVEPGLVPRFSTYLIAGSDCAHGETIIIGAPTIPMVPSTL